MKKLSNREMYNKAMRNGYEQVARFMRDMKRAGLTSKMRYYEGRFHWTGPGVTVDDPQEVLSNTKVKCQWDCMGLSYIVYPHQSIDLARELRDLGYRTTVETEEGRPDRLVRITEEWRQEQLTRETAVDKMARAVRNGEACVGDLIRLMAREMVKYER